MTYFLVSVSNKTNLELCIKYGLAGFTNSINGFWTFVEIEEGDYVSFLYGARVFNLYRVVKKRAFMNAETLGPWPPVTFQMSGKTYYFPFRLYLEPVRKLSEPMVRPEFAYVAENLLLRGGYRKTHFQADQVTFYNVSQMGEIYGEKVEPLNMDNPKTFIPLLTWDRSKVNIPEIFHFQELILQSLIRHCLSKSVFQHQFLQEIGIRDLINFEALGEKALPEGHIDILLKEREPEGKCCKIIIEVKTGKASKNDIKQLKEYMEEMSDECIAGVIIASQFSKSIPEYAKGNGISCFSYSFEGLNKNLKYSFGDLLHKLRLNFEGGKVHE